MGGFLLLPEALPPVLLFHPKAVLPRVRLLPFKMLTLRVLHLPLAMLVLLALLDQPTSGSWRCCHGTTSFCLGAKTGISRYLLTPELQGDWRSLLNS